MRFDSIQRVLVISKMFVSVTNLRVLSPLTRFLRNAGITIYADIVPSYIDLARFKSLLSDVIVTWFTRGWLDVIVARVIKIPT